MEEVVNLDDYRPRAGLYISAFPLTVVHLLAKIDAVGALALALHLELATSGEKFVPLTARVWATAGLGKATRRHRRTALAQLKSAKGLFVFEPRPGYAYRVRRGPAWSRQKMK
jgi:hypothetical protein